MALGKLFIKLWLFLLATSYTSFMIQTYVFDWQQRQSRTERPRSPFLSTTAEAVSWSLRDTPQEEWPVRFAELSARLTFPAEMLPLNALGDYAGSDLRPLRETIEKGGNGWINPMNDKPVLGLKRLPGSDYVLIIKLPPDEPRLIFGIFKSVTFTWIVESTMYGGAVLLWLSLFWRDLKKLGTAADYVGSGKFDVNVNMRRGSALRPLADSFNRMTARITALLNSHRELTNAVSHELRTPLARLRFALTLSEESNNPAERQQLLEKMQRDVDELDSLTREMLTYSRLDRDTPDFKLEPVPLEAWLPQVIEDETEAARAGGINLPVVVKAQVHETPADPKFLARAVSNLVRNALRFAKSKVEVAIARDNAQYVIHVDDDGPGIPAENREKLFIPFARLDESRTRESGGMGLGLAIVRRIAERHGGTATISASPLGGARITIAWSG